MSSSRHQWGYWSEQHRGARVAFSQDARKPRQRVRRHVEWDGRLPTVAEIADPQNLIMTFCELKARGGQAPGPDWVRYSDLGRRDIPRVMRAVGKLVISGEYLHAATRPVKIPKTNGFRTLQLANLCDRVISAALNVALTPFAESLFLDGSMGFRPGLCSWDVLARIEAHMLATGRQVLALGDVRGAYDHVAIDDVMAVLENYLDDVSLLTLARVVLQGSEGKGRAIGLDQGSAFSPLALNLLLHHSHDLAAERSHLCWTRYADDLQYLCQDMAEGIETLKATRAALRRVGLDLKDPDGQPRDLSRGETAEVLGFEIYRKPGGLGFKPGPKALGKIGEHLNKAQTCQNPSMAARSVVLGWFDALGPAFECNRQVILDQVLTLTAKMGFREISPDSMFKVWAASWGRWMCRRVSARKAPPRDEHRVRERRCRARVNASVILDAGEGAGRADCRPARVGHGDRVGNHPRPNRSPHSPNRDHSPTTTSRRRPASRFHRSRQAGHVIAPNPCPRTGPGRASSDGHRREAVSPNSILPETAGNVGGGAGRGPCCRRPWVSGTRP